MMALCGLKAENSNSKFKEIYCYLDMLKEAISGFKIHSGPVHAIVYFCLIGAEVYVTAASQLGLSLGGSRLMYEAGTFMLLAAPQVLRYPLMNALVIERAAKYFLMARYYRRYTLYEVIAANKFLKCGEKASAHASVCYSNVMTLMEKTKWGDILVNLSKKLALQLQLRSGGKLSPLAMASMPPASDSGPVSGAPSPLSPQRSLMLLLQIIERAVDVTQISGMQTNEEAFTVLSELLEAKQWGADVSVVVQESWNQNNFTIRQLLLGDIPVAIGKQKVINDAGATTSITASSLPSTDALHQNTTMIEIEGLKVPRLKEKYISLLSPFNGSLLRLPHGIASQQRHSCMHSTKLLVVELDWYEKSVKGMNDMLLLIDVWLNAEDDIANAMFHDQKSKNNMKPDLLDIPLEEEINVSIILHNPLPMGLLLSDVCLEVSLYDIPGKSMKEPHSPVPGKDNSGRRSCSPVPLEADNDAEACRTVCMEDFEIFPLECMIHADESKEIVLSVLPKKTGCYQVNAITYRLSNNLLIRQPIRKKGVLLQKTMKQRANKVRGVDTSLCFQVVPKQPLLNLQFQMKDINTNEVSNGFPGELLYGELVNVLVDVENVGTSVATNISLKFSTPTVVVQVASVNGEIVEDGLPPLRDTGVSGTIASLPERFNLLPKGSLKLSLWIYVLNNSTTTPLNSLNSSSSNVKKKFTMLSTYQTPGVEGLLENPRSSFALAEVCLLLYSYICMSVLLICCLVM